MLDILLIIIAIMSIGYVHFLKVTNRHRYEEIKYNLKNWFNK